MYSDLSRFASNLVCTLQGSAGIQGPEGPTGEYGPQVRTIMA